MRREFEMTEEDLERLLEASKPVMCIMAGNTPPRSPQQNANDAWAALGQKMGFKHTTAHPVAGKDQRVFTAEPEGDDHA